MNSLDKEGIVQIVDILTVRAENAIASLEYSYEPRQLYDPIVYALDCGGKRIRPLLLLLGYHIYKDIDETPKEVMDAALAVEMFHNFTLLHDDIMDRSLVRRGRPTVHVKWGENEAILSGDTMLTCSYKLLSGVRECYLKRALDIFNGFAFNIFEGQQYDMMYESMDEVSLDSYINMIRLKTAVLLSGSIKIGALLSGASDRDMQILESYAINLGLAFQLQDDMLDTFGDTATFGKEVGGDIASAKKTFLLITLLQRASSEDRAEIESMLASESMSREDKLSLAKVMFVKYGVDIEIKAAIDSYFMKALSAVEKLECSQQSRDMLSLLAGKLVNRDR